MRTLKAAGLVLLFLLPISAAAQIPTAATVTVSGTVSDPTGAVVPGAEVELLDTGTNLARSTTTDATGHYVFTNALPGLYKLTVRMEGFRQAVVPELKVDVAKAYTVDFTLEVGAVSEVVEVTAGVAVELQKFDSTVGGVLKGESLLRLPNLTRDMGVFTWLQPLTTPNWGPDSGTNVGGITAGARSDQVSYFLDGAESTHGRYGYYSVMPQPLESIEEFRVNITNPNATFGRASGAQYVAVSRRGTNVFHGSGYWYHGNDNLNANTWTRKRLGKNPATGKDKSPEPEMKDNRFGFSVGGPIWKERTFFYWHYEGRRYPRAADAYRIVPTDTFRAGTLRFRDASGVVRSYPLATSTMCGPGNVNPCDPRGLGLNPVVNDLWNKLPAGNDPSLGDGLNTIGFAGTADNSTISDFILLRLDHNFSEKWRFDGSYRYYRAETKDITLLDIGGILPGHTLGEMAPGGFSPNQPRYVTGGITGQITPRLTNEFRVGWLRTYDGVARPQPFAQVPSANMAIQVAGHSYHGGLVDEPLDVHTQRARTQFLPTKTYQFVDNATWVKGKHTVLFGGTHRYITGWNLRNDKVIGSLSALLAELDALAFVTIPAAYRPPTCGAGVTTDCLASGDVTRWNRLYAGSLGLIDNVGVLLVRDGSLNPLPIGTPLMADYYVRAYEFYFNDTWRVTPSFTLTLGASYQWHFAPVEKLGRFTFMINKETGERVTSEAYLDRIYGAALQGKIYNPDLAFMPIKSSGRKYIFDTDWSNLGPRMALAWNPSFKEGLLGRLFGDRKTVLRGGYAVTFDRLGLIQTTSVPMLGVGFGQTINIKAPKCDYSGTPGVGCNPLSADAPLGVFRIGVDGPAPIPTIPPASIPIVPSKPFGESVSYQNDPSIKIGRTHSLDFTIQREMPWDMLLETGWVVRFSRELPQNYTLSSVPFFHVDTASGQNLAKAFDLIAWQLRAGVPASAVTLQPWFQNQLLPLATLQAMVPAQCAPTDTSVTHCVARRFGSAFVEGNLTGVWLPLHQNNMLPSPIMNMQVWDLWMRGDGGEAYYSGVFFTLRKRLSHGLTFDLNYTIAKALDQIGMYQNNIATFSTSFFPNLDYGPTLFDRRHVFNANWFYDLPFGRGRRFGVESGVLDRLLGGWYFSGIFTANSGLPLLVCQSPYAYGGDPQGWGTCTGAIPLVEPHWGNSVHSPVAGSGGVGTTGNPATGGSGLNLFADPEAVLKSFRKVLVSEDMRSGRGVLRGLPRWNMDFSLGKKTKVTESVQIVLTFDFINLTNRVEFTNPGLDLRSPAAFGVFTSQGNTPRAIQIGFRVEF